MNLKQKPMSIFNLTDERRKDLLAIVCLAFLWLSVHAVLIAFYGYRNLFDANGYLEGADFLLANGNLIDIHHAFYITHISIIAFFRWIFPNLVYPTIIFQCILSGVALILLYRTGTKIFNNHLAGFLSCIIFLFWWDNIHWNTTLMTESLACSLMCFLIYVLSRFEGTVKDFISVSVLLILGFFTRPTGIIPIVGVVFFLLAYYWESINKVRRLKLFLVASIVVLGLFAADAMFLHWNLAENYVQGNIVTYMSTIEGTELYEPGLRLDPSELILPPEDTRPLLKILIFMYDNPIHFLKASTLKVWYLLSGIRPYYTTLHNVYTAVWMLIVYILFFFGWKQLTNNPIRVFVMITIMANCLIIAISTVDWDNRFYITMEPVIVLVAGRGGVFILEMLQKYLGFTVVDEWMLGKQTKN